MPRPIPTGLIGCGSLSLEGILPQLTAPGGGDRIDLVAVCDVVEERARAAAARFGVPAAYADAQALIDRADIELVLVVTPIAFHHRHARAALLAGKHVYVQKTMTTTYDEARELVALARDRNLVLVAAPGQMLAPAMRGMKRLVEEGGLGDVYWAWGSTPGWNHEYEPSRRGNDVLHSVDPSWYYAAGGGPQRDVTVYVLHSLTGILGPARRVAAMSGRRQRERSWRGKTIPVEVDDNTLLLLDFGNATFAVAGGHSAAGGRLIQWGAMGIYGSAGFVETLEIEPLSGHPTKLQIASTREVPELRPTGGGVYEPSSWLPGVDPTHAALPEPHVYADILHCADRIADGAAPIVSGAHGAHVVEIIEQGYLAAETGQTRTLESSF